MVVAKNGEFFSQPILGRYIRKGCVQRPGIAAGGIFYNVQPRNKC